MGFFSNFAAFLRGDMVHRDRISELEAQLEEAKLKECVQVVESCIGMPSKPIYNRVCTDWVSVMSKHVPIEKARPDGQDSTYAYPQEDWLRYEFFHYFVEWKKFFHMTYTKQRDCDDFARNFEICSRMVHAYHYNQETDPDTIFVGFVKAGGHVINWSGYGPNEIVWIEPQGHPHLNVFEPQILNISPENIYFLQM